ncbi:MAG: LptA/OstA family protein [Hyphomicrobiales bacterium]
MNTRWISMAMAMVAGCLAAAPGTAVAQGRTANTNSADSGSSVPNALQGFQQNRGQPVQIEAARLEVRDKQKVATFSGNVKVVQGDTTMRSKTLVVFYEQKSEDGGAPAMEAETPGPGGASQISRLEAKGNVIVTQKDQTATGDTGLFDMKANTVTLLSNVVVSQGQNVLRGERLVADLTTGVSRVDAGSSSGPVRMLIQQGGASQPPASAGSAPPALPKSGSQRSVY